LRIEGIKNQCESEENRRLRQILSPQKDNAKQYKGDIQRLIDIDGSGGSVFWSWHDFIDFI